MSPSEESKDDLTFSIGRILVCIIMSLSFVVGVPGNAVVIWTIWQCMKQRSLAVMLILNLAIADILVLVTVPLWIYSFAHYWKFGDIACKAIFFLAYSTTYASVFLITVLSLERYMAIFHPFVVQRRVNNLSTHLAVIIPIWLLSLGFGVSVLPFLKVIDTDLGLQCTSPSYETKSQEVAYILLESLVSFLLPFALISVCYARITKRISSMTGSSKQRSARLIAFVVVSFALCWLPYHFFNLMFMTSTMMKDSDKDASEALEGIANRGMFFAFSFAFLSSSVNPLLYAFAARNIRSSLRLTKLSKLFEQMNLATNQETPKELSAINGKGETLTGSKKVSGDKQGAQRQAVSFQAFLSSY